MLYRKFENNIPKKETALPQSQFLYIQRYVSYLYVYSHDRSAYLAAQNRWTDPGNKSVTDIHIYEYGNWEHAEQLNFWKYIILIFFAV